jgi:hypothetical protein
VKQMHGMNGLLMTAYNAITEQADKQSGSTDVAESVLLCRARGSEHRAVKWEVWHA